MTVSSTEGEITRSYDSSAVDKSCTAWGWFPAPSDIGKIVEEAFQKAVEKAIQDRDSYAQVKTEYSLLGNEFA